MSACSSRNCRASVLRLNNVNTGKPAPIDAAPVPDGNVRVLLPTAQYDVLAGGRLTAARADGEALHKNHWATCKDRERWEARKKQA